MLPRSLDCGYEAISFGVLLERVFKRLNEYASPSDSEGILTDEAAQELERFRVFLEKAANDFASLAFYKVDTLRKHPLITTTSFLGERQIAAEEIHDVQLAF